MAIYGIKDNKSLVDLDTRSGEFFALIGVESGPYLSKTTYQDLSLIHI